MAAMESEKTMFEVYRDSAYGGTYRVVYFTELNDHNKETEISRALSGEHFLDGFLKNYGKDAAKAIIDDMIEQLNRGEAITPEEFVRRLGEHVA
jgi:hypothetical protein